MKRDYFGIVDVLVFRVGSFDSLFCIQRIINGCEKFESFLSALDISNAAHRTSSLEFNSSALKINFTD